MYSHVAATSLVSRASESVTRWQEFCQRFYIYSIVIPLLCKRLETILLYLGHH